MTINAMMMIHLDKMKACNVCATHLSGPKNKIKQHIKIECALCIEH